jgi:hypothetical protein
MTSNEAEERFAKFIDDLLATSVRGLRDLLQQRGATEQKMQNQLQIYSDHIADVRANCLADLRGRLNRGGETLQ